MPIHLMQVIKLPQWLVQDIDRLRRKFLWRGEKNCLGGHCLVNWSKCCLPKQNGGLGIHNLEIQNEALLVKWVWLILSQPNSNWANTVRALYGTTDIHELSQHPLLSSQLSDILRTVRLFGSSFCTKPDGTVYWSWAADGIYSVSKAVKRLAHTGVIAPFYKIWRIRVPSKVKTFLGLLMLDRLLTQSNLLTRSWPTQTSCVLCQSQHVEDSDHLFRTCQFSTDIWTTVELQFNLSILRQMSSPTEMWLETKKLQTGESKNKWDVVWGATCWTLWKHRCRVIFDGDSPTLHRVLLDIELNVRNWSIIVYIFHLITQKRKQHKPSSTTFIPRPRLPFIGHGFPRSATAFDRWATAFDRSATTFIP
ncbi:RNA-directed DNA polymerase (reverse transcriptase)-related family protein [Rhynchospora pubera]|uniref:RNA-directed DNA polymerase (Reverse transcriptase)-related family protein n=1 Tax=Rhynchospora pubera TaxID=906938 RepID=A0AAV8HYB6_9POAL|nr:RNA-directed DNA polymerase (reverse transcriptase)-related family protein [Rhynchospora pubera]